MAGRERKFAPRLRTTRPLGETLTTNTPPNYVTEFLMRRSHQTVILYASVTFGFLLNPSSNCSPMSTMP